MDKRIPTLLFILLCIVIPVLWFSFRFSALAQNGFEKSQSGHAFLVSQLRNHIDEKGRITPISRTEVEFIIGLEPQVIGLCMMGQDSSILVQTPIGFTLKEAERRAKHPLLILHHTDITPHFIIVSVSSLVSTESMRSLGFEAMLLFAGSFFMFIIIIFIIPSNKRHMKNRFITPEISRSVSNMDSRADTTPPTDETSRAIPTVRDVPALNDHSRDTSTAASSNESAPITTRIRGTLFEPETGLCWAEDLIPRLDEEIKRSASFENELVVILSTIDMDLYEADDFMIFVETVKNFFSFRDMVFRYGRDGVAIILQNMDIDHALRMCDELIKKISYLIQQNKNEMHYVEAFFGMSARSGRIIDSTRIVREAEVALAKAREEHDTHIIAFKPDLEKYKNFLLST